MKPGMGMGVGLVALLSASAVGVQEKVEKPRVVITQADEDAIRKLLSEFRQHTEKPNVSLRSHLDCPAHADLLKHGWKAVPYLIDQAARQQSVEAALGAARIKDAGVKTPKEVAAWNEARRVRVAGDTIPVTVIPQGEMPTVDPADAAFKGVGSFRVTTNDGRVVVDYRKPTRDEPRKPPEPRRSLELSLDAFCELPAGEYNVSFRYGDRETPTVAIEIYERPGKK
jgi:hypothetical protein